MTTLSIGEFVITVPTLNVNLNQGRLYVEASLDATLGIPADQVVVVAHHPDPTLQHLQMVVSGLDPDLVSALMGQESGWSSMEDPIGLIAMRAIVRAMAGETPEDHDERGGL